MGGGSRRTFAQQELKASRKDHGSMSAHTPKGEGRRQMAKADVCRCLQLGSPLFRGPSTETRSVVRAGKPETAAAASLRQHPGAAAEAPPHPAGQTGGEGLLPQVQVSVSEHKQVSSVRLKLRVCASKFRRKRTIFKSCSQKMFESAG